MEQAQIDMFNGLCCGSDLQCIPPGVPAGNIDMIYDAHTGYHRGSVILSGSPPFSITEVLLEDPELFVSISNEIFGNVLYINAVLMPSSVDGVNMHFTITNPCGNVAVVRFLNFP